MVVKHFIIKNEINNTNIQLYDNNAFIKMFKESNKITYKMKKVNYHNTQRVNQILLNLAKKLKRLYMTIKLPKASRLFSNIKRFRSRVIFYL